MIKSKNKILFSRTAHKQLLKLPRGIHTVILERIKLLGNHDSKIDVKKLAGRDGYRLRIGDYRVIYLKDNTRGEVVILSVAHRREAYRK